MMREGAGRVHKVFAQSGEIRSSDLQYPIAFNLQSTRINGGELHSCMDLTEMFPNHSRVAFTALKTPSGRYEARELYFLEEPPSEEKAKLEVDYGIVSRLSFGGGVVEWIKYGQLHFVKESLVLKSSQDLPLPVNELLQIGRTVRFKADITGPRYRWNAISMTPLSDISRGRGRVTRVLDGHGWITSTEHGEVYFPFGRFMQPIDPDKRMPSPELLTDAEVEYEACSSLPGARGGFRAIRVRLLDE